MAKSSCPCGSGGPYSHCCQIFHQKRAFPRKAVELMRSRYTAYALGLFTYIMDTTHRENSQYKEDKLSWGQEILAFSHSTSFEGLQILQEQEGIRESFVTFRVELKQGGKPAGFTERSRFLKAGDQWFYVDGQIIAS